MIDNKYINIKKIYSVFFNDFNDYYRNYAEKEKIQILEYINSFFRKWYYSALIGNTELTPAHLVEKAGGEKKNIYPVILAEGCTFNVSIMEYNIERHPFLRDFRTLAEMAENVVRLNMDFTVPEELFLQLKGKITLYDREYISYIFEVGIEAGIFEKMPSVGVIAIKLGSSASKYLSMTDEDIFALLINAAVIVAARNLSCYFMGVYCPVECNDILSWLSEPRPIDEIFSAYYYNGKEPLDKMQLMLGNYDSISKDFSVDAYLVGVNIDKWFITPFGYYFRLIVPYYLCRYSYYDELEFFMAAKKEAAYIDDAVDSAIYSPCSYYRLTELGREFCGVKENKYTEECCLFETTEPNEVIDILSKRDINEYSRLCALSVPIYNIMTIRVDFIDSDVWLEAEISASASLSYLHVYVSYLFGKDVFPGQFFRFYKLPESPFTEYKPSYLGERGPKAETMTVEEFLEEGEICYYEMESVSDIRVLFRITNLGTGEREKNVIYPRVIKKKGM